MSTVYATRGRKYHTDPKCPLMINGEYLWDGDGEDWLHIAGSYRREDPTPQYAAMRGKLPCLHCVPESLRVFPPLYGQDFGHKPTDEYAGTPEGYRGATHIVCARCMTWTRWPDVGLSVGARVSWPCTSALVLGLVPREEATP
ncbi:hypothetical protein [Streptomyces sp. NPDC058424]|uniref:hypothetical protein n=1 Tax=Streptomyces sp. NPDC058424 TaxID=3346491 RepID=UPI00364D13F1